MPRMKSIVLLACLLGASIPLGAEELTPAEILSISRATGQQMKRSGFDQANNLSWTLGAGDAYDPRTDTVSVHPIADDATVASISLAQQLAATAAHEHCHAYLWKQRQHLPAVVRRAADRCNVLPQGMGGRTFDELFCDMAAIVTQGDSARQVFLALRESEDRSAEDPESPPDYEGHSYPLLKAAIAADGHEQNSLVRTAKAVASACLRPDFQALRGVEEKRMAEKLSRALGETMHWLRVPPKVTITPFAQMPKRERARLEPIRRDVGESIPLAFLGGFLACRQAMASQFPNLPDARQTMARCHLRPVQYADAFCGALSLELAGDVARSSFSYTGEVSQVVRARFGHQSLLAKLAQAEHDYALSVYASGDVVKDIGARLEYACGALPEAFNGLVRIDGNGRFQSNENQQHYGN